MRFEHTKFEYIFIDTRSGNYCFRGTVQGQFIDRSLKTKRIAEAKIRADKIRATPDDHAAQAKFTFQLAFDLALKIQATRSKKRYEETESAIRLHLKPWFQTSRKCIHLLTFEKNFERIWAEYILDQQVLTPDRSLKHDRKALIYILGRAYNVKWVRRLFTSEDLPLSEAETSIGKCAQDSDVDRMLKYFEPHPKIFLQVLIALTMGMRLREILHLHKDEIDLKNREINLDPWRIKIRRPRKVPIPISDPVYPLLRAAYQNAEGPYIFPAIKGNLSSGIEDPNKPQDSIRYWWDKMREDLKIDLRFHDLKHTAVTNSLARGIPSITVSKICGTSEKTMKRIYDHLKDDTKEQFRSLFNDYANKS